MMIRPLLAVSAATFVLAAPAIVGSIAVKPAYRPNTSNTRKRSCEPADVRKLFVI